MLNLKFGETLHPINPSKEFYQHFKDCAGDRHFATFFGKSELAFIRIGHDFDCILEWTPRWKDEVNCYLLHFFSDQEAFVVDFCEDIPVNEIPYKVLDCGLETCGFIELAHKMWKVKLTNEQMSSLIEELGPKVLGKLNYKRLSERHATPQFPENSFQFTVYQAMREIGCRCDQVIGKAAVRHGKIMTKLKEIVAINK